MTDAPKQPGMTAAQIAAKLGYSKWTFYRKRAVLETQHGFPKVMAGTTRYDPIAFDNWQKLQRGESIATVVMTVAVDWEKLLVDRALAGDQPPTTRH